MSSIIFIPGKHLSKNEVVAGVCWGCSCLGRGGNDRGNAGWGGNDKRNDGENQRNNEGEMKREGAGSGDGVWESGSSHFSQTVMIYLFIIVNIIHLSFIYHVFIIYLSSFLVFDIILDVSPAQKLSV